MGEEDKRQRQAGLVAILGAVGIAGFLSVCYFADFHKAKKVTSKLAPNAVYCDGDSHRIDMSNFYSDNKGGRISTIYIKADKGAEYWNLEENDDPNSDALYKITYRGR